MNRKGFFQQTYMSNKAALFVMVVSICYSDFIVILIQFKEKNRTLTIIPGGGWGQLGRKAYQMA